MRNYEVEVKARSGKYNARPKGGNTPQESCHIAKSFAGTIFQAENVYSVKVTDRYGTVYLSLDKFCPARNQYISSDYAVLK